MERLNFFTNETWVDKARLCVDFRETDTKSRGFNNLIKALLSGIYPHKQDCEARVFATSVGYLF
jgi:hypothetical protein